VHGAGAGRRDLLTRVLARPEILDGVMQGEALRLVTAEGAAAPTPQTIGSETTTISAVPPRFEDAFVALLGGQPKRTLAPPARQPERADGRPPVEARSLTRRFGSFIAADRISFEIGRGEIFGLLGPNGAGKSTTFKMMCGLLRPSEGAALVDGLDLYKAPSAARARLGYMAQKFSLYGDLSVLQNLEFFAGAYGLSGAKQREAVGRVIEAFDLKPFLSDNAGGLPLGFKQRLALSCAIMHEPPVLFLDEPTSGVDPLTRREFWGFINAMVGRGVTIMVTTHFMDEAEYCDRVALIYRGRCIAVDTPEALQQSVKSEQLPRPTLEDAFIALVEAHDRRQAAA
jgi:ABC-2 type transport system ATP-binding protein